MGRFCDLIIDTVLFLRGFDRVSLFVFTILPHPADFTKAWFTPF